MIREGTLGNHGKNFTAQVGHRFDLWSDIERECKGKDWHADIDEVGAAEHRIDGRPTCQRHVHVSGNDRLGESDPTGDVDWF